MTEEKKKTMTRTRVCTAIINDDAEAAALSERVDEILEDHPAAKVIWLQTPLGKCNGEVRLTAVMTWKD